MQQPINDATENLRGSLNRLYNKEHDYGVPHADIERFFDGGFLSDIDKATLTEEIFPHLVYDPERDRFTHKAKTYALLNATALLRRLVQKHRDKADLARKSKINFTLLDDFADGKKDLSPQQKRDLARTLGLNREYVDDTLVSAPASGPPLMQPPDFKARPWREQQVPTMRTVT